MIRCSRGALATLFLLLFGVVDTTHALEIPERRRDQFAGVFSYYLYPLAGEVPGMGRATGAGASVLNIAESETDFSAFKLDGDFSASGYALLDLSLLKHRLVADVGTYDFNVAQTQYGRGIDASDKDYILPRAQGGYHIGQLTLTFDQRRYETYLRLLDGQSRLLEVRDATGKPFGSIDSSSHDSRLITVGASVDLTDDHLDPRAGMRLEFAAKFPAISDELRSKFYVTDWNLTGYLPLRQRRDTLAFNLFRSDAHVTEEGVTDYGTLQSLRGLRCDALATVAERDNCYLVEEKYLNEMIAANRYGTATALGGTQRLRSFDNGRFYAGHALAYGVEYRWNITDENTPFNIYFAKGIRTGIQLALFAEQGAVADDLSVLLDKRKSSYGVGLRIVLSGTVLRADYANGDEGDSFQLFISYPWSMFSVDSPG